MRDRRKSRNHSVERTDWSRGMRPEARPWDVDHSKQQEGKWKEETSLQNTKKQMTPSSAERGWGGWEGGRCKREEKWEHIVYV